jgi:acetoin utilization deacetylase AcuC-like enzyme
VSLERIHTPRYLHFLRSAWSEWLALDPGNAGRDACLPCGRSAACAATSSRTFHGPPRPVFDRRGTPLTAGTWVAAKTGADCAINAAHALRLGERGSFALTRPPGHHAGADYFGGYCFLNNAALAAQHLLDDGLQRVAILDIDYHHGNGTQASSIAARTCCSPRSTPTRAGLPVLPRPRRRNGRGAGLGYNLNLPLPRGATPRSGSRRWRRPASNGDVRAEALVVSLGVDGFSGDPRSHFGLSSADFLRIGERIGWLGLPTAFVFEGGSVVPELGINVVNVLEGFETAA